MPTIDVTPSNLDLTLYAGDGFAMRISFINKSTGDPWPLEGTWRAQIRSTAAAADPPLAEFVIDDSDAVNGNIMVSLTGEDTRACLGNNVCFWDLEQSPPGGQPRTWYAGKVKVSQDVTRSAGGGGGDA
jgi:hypothetical protein